MCNVPPQLCLLVYFTPPVIYRYGGFLKQGYPSHHPFLDGIVPYEPSSYWGSPMVIFRRNHGSLGPIMRSPISYPGRSGWIHKSSSVSKCRPGMLFDFEPPKHTTVVSITNHSSWMISPFFCTKLESVKGGSTLFGLIPPNRTPLWTIIVVTLWWLKPHVWWFTMVHPPFLTENKNSSRNP